MESFRVANAWQWAKAAGVETLVSIETISHDHWADAKAIWQFVCGEHRWSLDEDSIMVSCRPSLRFESLIEIDTFYASSLGLKSSSH